MRLDASGAVSANMFDEDWHDSSAELTGQGASPVSRASSTVWSPASKSSKLNGLASGQAPGVPRRLRCRPAFPGPPRRIILPRRSVVASRVFLKCKHFPTPMPGCQAVRRDTDLQQMDEKQVQNTFDRMQLRQAQILDLLDDIGPVDIVHPLPSPETAQQIGLMLRPGEDITFIETVRHAPSATTSSDLRILMAPILGAVEAETSGLHSLAAVDMNLRPAEIERLVGAQEEQQIRHLARFAQPAHRDFPLHDLLGAGRQDRGVDLAG
jgi:hypothetical protein